MKPIAPILTLHNLTVYIELILLLLISYSSCQRVQLLNGKLYVPHCATHIHISCPTRAIIFRSHVFAVSYVFSIPSACWWDCHFLKVFIFVSQPGVPVVCEWSNESSVWLAHVRWHPCLVVTLSPSYMPNETAPSLNNSTLWSSNRKTVLVRYGPRTGFEYFLSPFRAYTFDSWINCPEAQTALKELGPPHWIWNKLKTVYYFTAFVEDCQQIWKSHDHWITPREAVQNMLWK